MIDKALFFTAFLLSCTISMSQDITAISMELQMAIGNTTNVTCYLETDLEDHIDRDSILADFGFGWIWLQLDSSYSPDEETIGEIFKGLAPLPGPGFYHVIPVGIGTWWGEISNLPGTDHVPTIASEAILSGIITNENTGILGPWRVNSELNEYFEFQPGIVNPDADSISFSFTDCGFDNYVMPTSIAIDQQTGLLSGSFSQEGHFLICTQVEEWKVVPDDEFWLSTHQYQQVIKVSAAVNLEDHSLDSLLSFYEIGQNLVILSNMNQNITGHIYSLTGQKISDFSFTDQVSIQLNEFASGTFFITLFSDDGRTSTRKFIHN